MGSDREPRRRTAARRAALVIVGLATAAWLVPARVGAQGGNSGGGDAWNGMQTAVTVAGTIAIVGGVVFVARFVPFVRKAPATHAATVPEAQAADLRYLRTLPRYDHSLRDARIRRAFETFVDSLALVDTDRTAAEFELEVARAVAIADNGHSSISSASRARRLTSDLPIRLARFSEGFHIVQVVDGHAELLGARVDSVEGIPTAEVVVLLERYHGGVPERAHHQAHLDLASLAVLRALGVARSDSSLTIAVSQMDGTHHRVTLSALAPRADRRRPTGRAAYLYELQPSDTVDRWRSLMSGREPPPPLREPGRIVDFHRLDGGTGIYARIGANANLGGVRVKRFAAAVADSVERIGARFAVVDLRDNSGGTTTLARAARRLIDVLPAEGRVYVITSPGTFSYGIATAALLRKHGGDRTVVVGEPVGDRLAFWANGGSEFTLPHSGIVLRAWTGREDYERGCKQVWRCFWLSPFFLRDGIGALSVDVPAPLSFHDYGASRDTALDAILRLESARRE